MTLIEIGAMSSAAVAVITLITKLFNLIAAIQALIQRLDQLHQEVNRQQDIQAQITQRMNGQDSRLEKLEHYIFKRGKEYVIQSNL